jgi:threonine synthase
LERATLEQIRSEFGAAKSTVAEIGTTIAQTLKRSGYLLDPHTAAAVHASENCGLRSGTPVIVLGTAHPSKFPAVVEEASGVYPNLPETARSILERKERYDVLPADLRSIEDFILDRSPAAASQSV